MANEGTNPGASDPFETFLLTEYSNLAQAFFSAGNTLTQFFQYYLLALGVPLTAAGIAVKLSDQALTFEAMRSGPTGGTLGLIFLVIGLVGLCMAAYIMNLRMDAVLYARSVNGIRAYFYALRPNDDDIAKHRVLNVGVQFPPFLELRFFGPVVAAFALLNSAYLISGLVLLLESTSFAVLLGLVLFILHFGIYDALAGSLEKQWTPPDAGLNVSSAP